MKKETGAWVELDSKTAEDPFSVLTAIDLLLEQERNFRRARFISRGKKIILLKKEDGFLLGLLWKGSHLLDRMRDHLRNNGESGDGLSCEIQIDG